MPLFEITTKKKRGGGGGASSPIILISIFLFIIIGSLQGQTDCDDCSGEISPHITFYIVFDDYPQCGALPVHVKTQDCGSPDIVQFLEPDIYSSAFALCSSLFIDWLNSTQNGTETEFLAALEEDALHKAARAYAEGLINAPDGHIIYDCNNQLLQNVTVSFTQGSCQSYCVGFHQTPIGNEFVIRSNPCGTICCRTEINYCYNSDTDMIVETETVTTSDLATGCGNVVPTIDDCPMDERTIWVRNTGCALLPKCD